MKKINFLASLLAMVLCIGFTACGDGDDSDDNGEGAGTGNVFPEGTKRLASIIDGRQITSFTYDGDKLVSVKDGDDVNITFEYKGNAVVMTSTYTYTNGEATLTDKNIYTLNIGSNGFATSGTMKYIDANGSEDNASFTLRYEGDHFVALEIRNDGSYDNYALTWANGNITQVVNRYKEEGYDEETNKMTASYQSEANTAGLSFFEETGADVDELEYAYYAGLLGKSTANLLKSTMEPVSGGVNGGTTTYAYELNADNYPIKITESYSYDGGAPSTYSKTLTYK